MYSWSTLIPLILSRPPHVDVMIPDHLVPDPKTEGFRVTLGEPHGQIADYELTLKDGRRVHVRKFEKFYKAHWDKVSPLIDFIGHLRYDAQHWWVILWSLGCAVLGSFLYEEDKTTGTIFGGLMGALLAVLSLPRR